MTILMLPHTPNVPPIASNPSAQAVASAAKTAYLAAAKSQGERGGDVKPSITAAQQIAAMQKVAADGAGQAFQQGFQRVELANPAPPSPPPQSPESALARAVLERRQPAPPTTGGHETLKISQDLISSVATLLSTGRGDPFLSALSEGS